MIDGPEVIEAVKDYFADKITGSEVIGVVKLYFAGRSELARSAGDVRKGSRVCSDGDAEAILR